MAPESSTSRKIRRATVLAGSGRFLSLADLAAAVRLSESTLRRYGVTLPATTPADIPDIAAAAAAYSQPDETPGQYWHVEHIPADGMGRRQLRCLNKRNLMADDLASSLNTQRAAFTAGRDTSRKDESVHAVVSGPVDIGELRSMLPEGATVSIEPPGPPRRLALGAGLPPVPPQRVRSLRRRRARHRRATARRAGTYLVRAPTLPQAEMRHGLCRRRRRRLSQPHSLSDRTPPDYRRPGQHPPSTDLRNRAQRRRLTSRNWEAAADVSVCRLVVR